MRFETRAVHAGGEPDEATGAIAPPIHLSTTFEHGPGSEPLHGFLYQREANPTQERVEAALAALDGGVARVRVGSIECIPDSALGTAVVADSFSVLSPRDPS